MTLSEELNWRGFIKDKTFADASWLDTPRKFYLGTDCSSDSLTIGNLAVYMLARQLVEHGWQAVLLVGGATSLIGDPGGKDEERPLKSRAEIEQNVVAIKAQVSRLFAQHNFEPADNYDWFKDMGYLEFLRDVGKHYSMTELNQREFVASRMGEGGGGISYAEFSYSLIQGYDYWWLYKHRGVELQIGASDQWGNMLSGVPLIRKKEGKEVHALCMPLIINKATGKKFGKSEAGAIWLDPAKTTPTQFYQFWMNVDDTVVEAYLKIYTLLSQAEITDIMAAQAQAPAARSAQKRLAQAVTELVHGADNMAIAEAVTNYLTGKSPIGEAMDVLTEIRQEIPAVKTVVTGSIIEALVAAGLAASNTEGRRFITGNAVTINGRKVAREYFQASDFQQGRLLLRKGKAFKDSVLVEL